ncbi:MAG: helicase-associated domain-containing protein [Deltaproteobacteria bacterium]|nr:helicase-associated domain-containing protein [Deltaproteobacteria bacterium]
MGSASARPLIVQSDGTVLLEVDGPGYEEARDFLGGFAQLERSPEHVHTYRLTPLSLWNAAAVGFRYEPIAAGLERLSRFPVPNTALELVREQLSRYGRTRLTRGPSDELLLASDDPAVLRQVSADEHVGPLLLGQRGGGFAISAKDRGALKVAMIRLGHPVEDLCGYVTGTRLEVSIGDRGRSGEPFALRPYQSAAVNAFHAGGGPSGGAGVIVLPCGSGKTIVGIGVLSRVGARTLVLTTSTLAVHQWIDELLERTNLSPESIGEYTGLRKDVRPVTIATYQMLTHRPSKESEFPHLELLRDAGWGLIVYDEVHMLPAPVFRATAELQARRRLGLTATLVREDGREDDVFALIGPKRYEVPWRVLEGQGYIAEASCSEVRVELSTSRRVEYALANRRDKFRIAAENPLKEEVVAELLVEHSGEPALVIGQYIDQLERVSKFLDRPLITGSTPQAERERLFDRFRRGEERVLVVSKVANFAIDLPDASLLIQVSGTYGSRQEEAQRLGRILRPKARPATFYTIVSRDTVEQEFARKRQMFLVEQGYGYQIMNVAAGG